MKSSIALASFLALSFASASHNIHPDDGLMGWATQAKAGLPTGGTAKDGISCTASTLEQLQACVTDANTTSKDLPFSLLIKGTIKGATAADGTGWSEIKFERGNLSVLGVVEDDNVPTLEGVWVKVGAVDNVIMRNLRFIPAKDGKWSYEGECTLPDPDYCVSNAEPDGLTLEGTTRAWIDHNEFTDGAGFESTNPNKAFYKMYDGLMDIKKGANYITVSYNKFSSHDKTTLVGSSDKIDGEYKITFYRNYYQFIGQRAPRVRNGQVHVLNNLYENTKKADPTQPYFMTYAIGLGFNSQVLSEGNAFDVADAKASDIFGAGFKVVATRFTDKGSWLNGVATDFNAVVQALLPKFDGPSEWTPPYAFTALTNVDEVRDIVKANAGVVQPTDHINCSQPK